MNNARLDVVNNQNYGSVQSLAPNKLFLQKHCKYGHH